MSCVASFCDIIIIISRQKLAYTAHEDVIAVYFIRRFKRSERYADIEAKFNQLSETVKYGQQLARIGYWLYEIETGQVFWSEQVFNILGCGFNSLNETLESFLPYVHADDLEAVEEATQLVKAAKEYDVEYRIVAADNQLRYVRERTKVITDEDNTPIKVAGIIQDITEQKLRENSLREIGDNLSKAQKVAGVGSWKYDIAKDELYCTDEVFNIYDTERTELKTFDDILKRVHPDDQGKVTGSMDQLRSGKSVSVEYRITLDDGAVKYVESNAEPIINGEGQITGVFGTTQDITEKKLLHDDLERSYRSLLEVERIAKMGSWEIDLVNRKVLFCSDEVYKMYGIPKGRTDIDIKTIMEFVHPDDRPIIMDIYKNTSEKQPVHFELRVRRPDGSILYVDNFIEITFDENGNPAHMHGTSQDITEKKELQKEMELVEKRVLHLSTHDQLTGMPNKIGFDNKIDILAKGALENNTSFAIIMLDIDSLRYVKNTLGYEAAEEYIVQIALKLRLYCGQTKFISHYSYNRFIIIFEGTHPMEVYGSFIKGIYALFSQPLKVDKYELDVETSFVEKLTDTIEEFGLDPGFLIMETTESVLMEKSDKVTADIKKLQSLGIQIALDDFGTGYSSLTSLSTFDIDILKIDGSLIKNIEKDLTCTVITRHIVRMAQELDIKLVAERVETWDQLTFLRELKCYSGQGYIYSRPVPPEEFVEVLARKECTPVISDGITVHGERRKFFRIKFPRLLETDLTILEIKGRKVNVGNTKVLVKNIGPGGLCFISNIRLPVDENIILQFRTYLIGEEVRVYGCTVWTRDIYY